MNDKQYWEILRYYTDPRVFPHAELHQSAKYKRIREFPHVEIHADRCSIPNAELH
jgi:hypothetical protein